MNFRINRDSKKSGVVPTVFPDLSKKLIAETSFFILSDTESENQVANRKLKQNGVDPTVQVKICADNMAHNFKGVTARLEYCRNN